MAELLTIQPISSANFSGGGDKFVALFSEVHWTEVYQIWRERRPIIGAFRF